MADNVSSKVLFHFTRSLKNLKGILRDGFSPRYCPEYTLDPLDKEAARSRRRPLRAAPMVCFCDLPLSLIRNHLKDYGPFGIGLDKKWGIRHGVSPVIYTHATARTRRYLSNLTTSAKERADKDSTADLNVLAAYTKPYRGPAWRHEKVKRGIRFYDEREWRYVPVVRGKPLHLYIGKDFKKSTKRRELEVRFKTLPVDPQSVQYLILPYIKGETNVLDLHKYLIKLYSRRYGRKEAILATSAIMTDNCIKEDI